ncbi:Uma2 family endonuclease [Streptomyces sp. NBC_01136]|uniref:Uma2 family endonuclease n=1 Tax=unclassified Streptomyces TaxID=2593676 RepID=UPI0032484E5C|nr:Uma2 family endonuclease [Streptomyces sp. NBC_01136]
MTPGTAERPQMSVEDFEELAAKAPKRVKLEFLGGRLSSKYPLDVEDFEELERRAPETVRLEYINGELRVKAMPDGNHRSIFMWLLRQCMQQRPDLDLVPESGVKAEAYRKGRARTDGSLVPVDHFRGDGEWSEAEGVLMAVEITSHDRDTDQRDRIDKPIGYAEANIPIYLLIDRDDNTVTVFSEPKEGRYQLAPSYPWGSSIELPAPVNITLKTEKLKDYAD